MRLAFFFFSSSFLDTEENLNSSELTSPQEDLKSHKLRHIRSPAKSAYNKGLHIQLAFILLHLKKTNPKAQNHCKPMTTSRQLPHRDTNKLQHATSVKTDVVRIV